MQHATKKSMLFDLDIQLFAEPNPTPSEEPAKDENPKDKQKYSDEDYLKLKANFDKTSSEIAELKKQLKSKQTDDEKKAEEEQNRQKEMDDLRKEVASYKIKSSLQDGFEKEEVDKLLKSIIEGDTDSLVKNLVEIRKAYKEKIYAQAKEEFSKSAKIPGGNGGGDEVSADVQNYLNSKKGKNQVDAKDYYGLGARKEKQDK